MSTGSQSDYLGIYFLDVGQGDCTLIVPPGDVGAVLFDCADAYTAERFIVDHDLQGLRALVVSHLDEDHFRGCIALMDRLLERRFTVDRAFLGLDRDRSRLTRAGRELIQAALTWHARGVGLEPSVRGDAPVRISSGSNWTIELVLPQYSSVLQMQSGSGLQPNACSAVLRIERGGNAVLVGGDASTESLAELEIERLPAAAFRVPHHGGASSRAALERMYSDVRPGTAVFSVGTRNRYQHPRPVHFDLLRSLGCRRLCTQMTSHCAPDPLQHRAGALDDLASSVMYPYRHRVLSNPGGMAAQEVPCAGSVAIWIAEDGSLTIEPPPEGTHARRVALLPNAMCR